MFELFFKLLGIRIFSLFWFHRDQKILKYFDKNSIGSCRFLDLRLRDNRKAQLVLKFLSISTKLFPRVSERLNSVI